MSTRASFQDRRAAGVELAGAVKALGLDAPIVLALPRGGVPVGFEVAKMLHAPLEVLMVRKIGAPGHEEYAIGAVVDGSVHQVVIDEPMARMTGADRDYIDMEIARQLAEIERRRALYGAALPVALKGRNIIIVDDGIATGSTVRAALEGLARTHPASIVLAVPLAPADTLAQLAPLCDQIVCLLSPYPFYAVGMHYQDFEQTQDAEVVRLLKEARCWTADQDPTLGASGRP